MQGALIAVDWGTSNFRAYRLAADGSTLDETTGPDGISTVPPGGFPAVLARHFGGWRAAEPHLPLVMAGMVGSRNGWSEAPYAPLPADATALRERLHRVALEDGGEALIVPGVSGVIDGVSDVIRGEETLAIGTGLADGIILSPGTHPKWIEMRSGRIARFQTFMTGEIFAVMSEHSLLGRLMTASAGEADDLAGFDRGLDLAEHPAGVTRALFAVRSEVLLGRLPAAQARPFLSGLLIGVEIAGAKASFGLPKSMTLLAEGAKAVFYERALARHGVSARRMAGDRALVAGLRTILLG
jgi:2-dehydro-3-deoxygalactonokinase